MWFMKQRGEIQISILALILIVVILVVALFFGLPIWNKWRVEISGQAELAKAQSTRQIKTLEAKQELESAKYLNEAEIVRAKGAAEANQVIADGLGGPEGYLRYLWIQGLKEDNGCERIYIPTEAGLPLLEAAGLKR